MRSRNDISWWVLLVLIAASVGCSQPEPAAPGTAFYPDQGNLFSQSEAERDSVLAALATVRQQAFQEAFSLLPEYVFTRYTRTEQFDDEDYLVAYTERTVHHTQENDVRSTTVESADSAGAFDFGFFKRFVSENVDDIDPVNLAPHLIPKDPPYLAARNYDLYLYRFLSDTLLWDAMARVIEIRARPEAADGKNIRRVRLFVDRGTNELVAMYLERIDLALFFREESQYYVHIRRAPDGEWVPYNSRFHTLIRTPLQTAQQFRTVSTYYDYAPVG